jgi:hypothetical protein
MREGKPVKRQGWYDGHSGFCCAMAGGFMWWPSTMTIYLPTLGNVYINHINFVWQLRSMIPRSWNESQIGIGHPCIITAYTYMLLFFWKATDEKITKHILLERKSNNILKKKNSQYKRQLDNTTTKQPGKPPKHRQVDAIKHATQTSKELAWGIGESFHQRCLHGEKRHS